MLARGALGNPWLFAELRRRPRARRRRARRCCAELDWTIERAVEHLGEPRATRYLRKFYPWYVARLRLDAQQRQAPAGGAAAVGDAGATRAALLERAAAPLALAV